MLWSKVKCPIAVLRHNKNELLQLFFSPQAQSRIIIVNEYDYSALQPITLRQHLTTKKKVDAGYLNIKRKAEDYIVMHRRPTFVVGAL